MMAPIYLEMSTQDAQTLFCPTTEMGREDEPCESGRASEIDRYVVARRGVGRFSAFGPKRLTTADAD